MFKSVKAFIGAEDELDSDEESIDELEVDDDLEIEELEIDEDETFESDSYTFSGFKKKLESIPNLRATTKTPTSANRWESVLKGPLVVKPNSFSDASKVADEFVKEKPVVMDLRSADKDLSRRFIDFSSGVCYALGGGMEKLGSKVFLIVPKDVKLARSEMEKLNSEFGDLERL